MTQYVGMSFLVIFLLIIDMHGCQEKFLRVFSSYALRLFPGTWWAFGW